MDKDFDALPLSESSVSLRLADIRKRCSELIDDDELGGLTLEEPGAKADKNNPYNCG